VVGGPSQERENWCWFMPTVLRVKGYRFFFFSREGLEPPHIHVEQAERYAKFWLVPVCLVRSEGFRQNELTEVRDIIDEHQRLFLEKWHERSSSKN
jgi:hypothetical protein